MKKTRNTALKIQVMYNLLIDEHQLVAVLIY